MPISNETIIEANRKMLGKTNRAVLFAKVNLDEFLDPDQPEDERELTPTLARMLAKIDDTPEEQFLSEVREGLTVTSFPEFLTKFQPGFYYRVRGSQAAAAQEGPAEAGAGEVYEAGGEMPDGEAPDGEASAEAATESAPAVEPAPPAAPQLEFSLKGGPGWTKIRITADHPYVRCLRDLISKRVRQDVTTFRVDVDASLFAFKPKNQRTLMRKAAEDVQIKNDRLMLEVGRNPGSKDTMRALESYQGVADEFQGALTDYIRVLPTVVYGLEQTAKELKRASPGGGPVDTNVYQIEFGKNRALIASPRQLPSVPSLPAPGAAGGAAALTDGGPKGLLEQGAGGALVKTEGGALAKAPMKSEGTALAVRSLDSALEKIREESKKHAGTDIKSVPQDKRFPIAVGKFMDKMIDRGLIQPMIGNLVATVLQNPQELVLLSPDLKDVEYYHDMFLGIYSNAVEAFLQTVTPLMETIMGVYLLFNEFPADVRLPDGMKPQLVIANADLPDLFLSRPEELKRYFEAACAQANNQFKDAVSFVIVPNVAPFKKKRPAKKKAPSIMLDDPILAAIAAAQEDASQDDDSYGRVTFADEMLPLMDMGYQFGFQVLFSPEERVRAGRTKRESLQEMNDAYAIDTVVDTPSGDAGIMCLPDFIIMPPDGKLVTGKTSDGNVEIGVDVPELTVRSCYLAAGRLMANDVPAYLQRKLMKAKKDPTSMRMDVPGIGIDLSVHPYLGETDMPTDHFLADWLMADMLSPNMPFLAFTHVSGRSPFLSIPRTMRRQTMADGSQAYRHLHLFRQEIYLNRLLRAAHELGYGGAFPADKAQAEAMIGEFIEYILKWTKWYDPDKIVNSFPSKLTGKKGYEVVREEGNYFKMRFTFEQGLISEFGIRF